MNYKSICNLLMKDESQAAGNISSSTASNIYMIRNDMTTYDLAEYLWPDHLNGTLFVTSSVLRKFPPNFVKSAHSICMIKNCENFDFSTLPPALSQFTIQSNGVAAFIESCKHHQFKIGRLEISLSHSTPHNLNEGVDVLHLLDIVKLVTLDAMLDGQYELDAFTAALEIVDKFLVSGKRDIIGCQSALLDAGLEKFANYVF